MAKRSAFQLTMGESSALQAPTQKERPRAPRAPKLELDPRRVARALKATAGFDAVQAKVPDLAKWQLWWPFPVATFTVCQKTGTAAWLDIWDADHFDGFTDMQRSVSDCRAWFSGDGYTFWDSAQTKTGRVNAYFRAPTDGRYLCNVQLQSYGGPAQVQCLIDSFNFGPLPFNGTISQPHYRDLKAGYHSFRIRQDSGSYFFVGLTVWKA
jgi:hypothetical protein